MKLEIRLFAAARQLVDQDIVRLDCPASTTVAELRAQLSRQYPQLAELLPHTRFAVDAQYVADSHVVHADDEVALIPPVSGG